MREKEVERKLVRAVRDAGGLALKFVSPGMAGVPDRLLLFPGRANLLRPPVADISQECEVSRNKRCPLCGAAPIEAAGRAAFCEVKAPGEKPRPLQLHRMEQLRELGFRVYVVDSEEKIGEMMCEIQSS